MARECRLLNRMPNERGPDTPALQLRRHGERAEKQCPSRGAGHDVPETQRADQLSPLRRILQHVQRALGVGRRHQRARGGRREQ